MSEQQIEQGLIERLVDLKYNYRADIRDRASLERNFREKFEALNRVTLTDAEFGRLLVKLTIPDVFEAARHLREHNSFEREDGTPLYYTLVNIKDWCKNTFEVINQLRMNTDYSQHRYDVIILINGIPVVQIELKSLDINPRRAIEQIVNYKNDTGNGYKKTLLCFMQLFIVSNRTDTCYFANNSDEHFKFNAEEQFLPVYRYADRNNKEILHLFEFADRFLAKCTLGQTISKYMVLVASEKKLMMMRPYQVYAVETMIACIDQHCGNGYIWHTTGSGKTLTSFKASTLLKDNPKIHKCLFVVDRKDLDRQTRIEFNKFQENCVEENTNTVAFVRRLLSDDYADKVIVTTIQKLGLALDEDSKYSKRDKARGRETSRSRLAPLRDKRMVFIFDECHRSQFGENHKAIRDFFSDAQLFGFTGTPIFEKNASYWQIDGREASLKTTKDIFEHELHAYTITHAIKDRNVLGFHVDYYRPCGKNDPVPEPGKVLNKKDIVEVILKRHDNATNNRRFNALLATASINDAIEYYDLFKTRQAKEEGDPPPLNIACIFSPPAEGNKDARQRQGDLPQEEFDNKQKPDEKKAALKAIIDDYNTRYGTSHSINEFDAWYQDMQKRIKDQQYPNTDVPRAQKIDITIVVDMLLTGFDSKYLNTLYVDKNLKHHGLIQAFSRTNRVLNGTKPQGNILDFRQQQDNVDDAISLFSNIQDGQPDQAREIWLVEDAPAVIDKLEQAVAELTEFMEGHDLEARPEQVRNLKDDTARLGFAKCLKEVQRLHIQLDQYTDLTEKQRDHIKKILPRDDLRAYRGAYLDEALYPTKGQQDETGTAGGLDEPDRDQFDYELVLFASADIDYDYIMMLIARYSGEDQKKRKVSRKHLIGLIGSDAKFLDDRDEIIEYVDSLKPGQPLDEDEVREGYIQFKDEKRNKEIESLALTYGLAEGSLPAFVDSIFEHMIFNGEHLTDLMEPLGLGWRDRRDQELALMTDLIPLLYKRAEGRKISGLKGYENEGV